MTTLKLSVSSQSRIEAFVDWFIRSEWIEGITSDRDSDFINYPKRAARCHDAAVNGADGKLHAEVIQDWRDCFESWIQEKRHTRHVMSNGETRYGWYGCEWQRFQVAVNAHFDAVEDWHHKNGSLWEQVG